MEELRLSGALDARPGRYKDRIEAGKAAQSTKANPVAQYAKASIGRPPAHLTTDEKKVWNEIVKQSPALTQSDRLLLEVATKLLCKMRTDGLKSAENTKLINLLEGFKGTVASPQPIPVTNAEPAETLALRQRSHGMSLLLRMRNTTVGKSSLRQSVSVENRQNHLTA